MEELGGLGGGVEAGGFGGGVEGAWWAAIRDLSVSKENGGSEGREAASFSSSISALRTSTFFLVVMVVADVPIVPME